MKKFKIVIEAKNKTALKKELKSKGVIASEIVEVNEDDELLTRLNECISNEEFEDDKHILEFLRNADEKTLDEMAHGYEFEAYEGCEIEIIMWQPLEYFTLRQLATHLGL